MIEAVIPIALAGATGFSVLISRLHSRVSELDKRIDGFELRVAESYLSKAEFSAALERVEAHMIRIEQKLDNLVK
jgi:hypothetical protein